MQPRLIFFCELGTPELVSLFENESVLPTIKKLGAGISLGILDLSEDRANIVKGFNQAGIPVIAWLLLPKEQGYWSNIRNVRETISRYEAFKEWSVKYNLAWFSVAFDIEPDLKLVENGLDKIWSVVPQGIVNLFRFRYFNQSKKLFNDLVEKVKSDGFNLEVYQFPLIVDERLVKTTFLQRLSGIVDLKTDREILLLYSSFLQSVGSGLIWSYGKDANFIGIGSTGGGVQFDQPIATLVWSDLERDLRAAWHWVDDIYIFSLEGCVQQNFLEKLLTFEWDHIILEPTHQTKRIDRWRISFQLILGLITYIPFFFIFGFIFSILIYNLTRRK